MSWWIGTVFEPRRLGEVHEDAFFADADNVDEAAAAIAQIARDHWDENGNEGEPIENVFVAPWDTRAVFTTRIAVDRSELQCCGGGVNAEHVGLEGHWATCPHAPEREESHRG